MINEDRTRVNRFDSESVHKSKLPALEDIKEDELEIDKFDNPDASHSTIVNPPTIFKGSMKPY